MRRTGIALLIIFMGVLTAVLPGVQKANTDEANVRAAIAALKEAYAQGDGAKAASFYAEDAMYLVPDMELLKGKTAIADYLTGLTGETAEFNQEPVVLKVEGNLAYAVVNQVVTVHRPGQADKVFPNKFFHLWKKQADGSWKLLIDAVSARPAQK